MQQGSQKINIHVKKKLKSRIMDNIRQWMACLLDILFPRYCIYSGKPIAQEEPFGYINKESIKAIKFLNIPTPKIAVKSNPRELSFNKTVNDCPNYPQNLALWTFEGLGEILIHRLKYQKERFLLQDIEKFIRMMPAVSVFLDQSILVPVPLHPKRMQQRGFNQSNEIAQILAKIVPSCSVCQSLKRTFYNRPQVGLTRKKRLQNVKNAFASVDSFPFDKSMRYIIVDDVYTTGATANACATVLSKKGITKVDVFTLARG